MSAMVFFMISMLTQSVSIFYYIENFDLYQDMDTDYVHMEHMKNAIKASGIF